MSNYLIKNATVLTMNQKKDIVENGVVVVKDDKIHDIGGIELESKYPDYTVIDGKEGILVPGMVNCHTHNSMVIFRSLGDDVADRLTKYMFPLEKMIIDKDVVYLGAKYGATELALGGVTTFADMYYFEDEVAKATEEVGLRAVLGETVVNFVAPDTDKPYGGIKYSEEFIKKWKNNKLITPAIAPHATYSLDDEHLKECQDLAKREDVPVLIHIAETKKEKTKYQDEYSLSPVKYLDSIGFLDKRVVGAHMIYVDDEDIEILKKREVGVSHNMGANSKGAHGISPAYKMYKEGLKIGLGSDGPMSGNTIDIFSQMHLVAKFHKLYNDDRTIFTAKEILEMATIGGARALNMEDQIGSIEVGKKADIVLVETDSVNMQPIYDPYSVLVYSANASNVEMVMVDGEIVVRDKKPVNVDYKKLASDMRKLRDKINNAASKL